LIHAEEYAQPDARRITEVRDKVQRAHAAKDWPGLDTALIELTKIDPKNIEAWKLSAWNAAYNITERDSARISHYEMTREGIMRLLGAIEHNPATPSLWWDCGWLLGQRLCASDKASDARPLFREDKALHQELERIVPLSKVLGSSGAPDNWQAAKFFYQTSVRLFDDNGSALPVSILIANGSAPAAQSNYAEALDHEGFIEEARDAWMEAERLWTKFGSKTIVLDDKSHVRLESLGQFHKEAQQAFDKIDEISPRVREIFESRFLAQLEQSERDLMRRSTFDANQGDKAAATAKAKLEELITQTNEQLSATDRRAAVSFGLAAASATLKAIQTRNYRTTMNYDWWLQRCRAEQTAEMRTLRKACFEILRAKEKMRDQVSAKEDALGRLYVAAFRAWESAFSAHEELRSDSYWRDRASEFLDAYRRDLPDAELLRSESPLLPVQQP
jgi:hypothetical protein